ncbi:MAG: T9SS type A sorting domain-containing protein [Melioribacteraceae bacterium]|nr:T9SS type A sorting domain-containing protein [Melioribacteraceae bacterium]
MKKIIFGVVIILYNSIGYSQVTNDWVKTFGGAGSDICFSVAITNDNNYVVVGRVYSEVLHVNNYMILKLNNNGEELWEKTSNCSNNDEARTVITNNDELIIAGNRGNYPLILKTNISGDTIWTRHINDDPAMFGQMRAMGQISDSNYIMVGVNGDSQNINENKIWVIRVDNDGNVKWSKTYTKGFASALTITGQNEILVIGGNQLLKLNENGDIIWNKNITGNYSYEINSVEETIDRGFILVGASSSCCYKDLCLIKTDSVGNKLWEKTYGGEWEEVGKDVRQTSDGNYLVLGKAPISNSGGAYKLWLIKMDVNGDTLWTQKFNILTDPFSYAYPESFYLTEENYIIAVGTSTTTEIGNRWFVSKYSLVTSDIQKNLETISNEFALYQNYPNPFNSSTKIKFNIPYSSEVKLNIYDLNGRLISHLLNQNLSQGTYEIEYDATSLSSGIYFYQLQNNKYIISRKMILLK